MANLLPTAQYGMLFYEKPAPEDIYSAPLASFNHQTLAFNPKTVVHVQAAFSAHAPASAKLAYLHPEITTFTPATMVNLAKQGYAFNTWGLAERMDAPRTNLYRDFISPARAHNISWGIITDDIGAVRELL